MRKLKISKIGRSQEYKVVALDADGDWISSGKEAFNLRDAKKIAKDMIKDPEYVKAGIETVQVLDESEDVVFDIFV
jgi:hypothetical protein